MVRFAGYSYMNCSRITGVCFAVVLGAGLLPAPVGAQSNPTVVENQQPGTTAWNILDNTIATDAGGQIKGYASATSVNKGENITFHISVKPAQTFTIDVYRIGWYQGLGGRLMQHIGPLSGTQQPTCPTNATTGMIECNWAPAYTLTTQLSWTSGAYVAVLTNSQQFQNYIVFVVRDDARVAPLLFQQGVTTYQAYNNYPDDSSTGKSLYGFNSYGANTVMGDKSAAKVSFDRPYSGNGAGMLLDWEVNFIKWMEKNGYDVTYSTNIDTHVNGSRLLNYRGFVSVGHDEYYSKVMYDAVTAARDSGVNLAFFGANSVYTQIRFESSTGGVPNRVIVCYRDADRDPNTNPQLETVNWRDPPLNRAEQQLVGVQYIAIVPWSPGPIEFGTYTVRNSGNWVYEGTGFADNNTVPGIVGYEADRFFSEYPAPVSVPGTYTLLSQSTFSGGSHNASAYQAPSGAWVFSSGSMSWNWALDNFGSGWNLVDARIQRATANVLNRVSAGVGADFSVTLSPASQTVTPGFSTAYNATINTIGGFNSPVTLSVTGLPAGATGTFSPNPATTSSTLTVTTTASTPLGSSTLTVTGVNGSLTHTSPTVVLNVATNTPPTISNILDQAIDRGTSTGSLAFTIGDVETAPGSLTVSGSSNNTTLVPNTNIVFGGSGANRTVTVTPVATQTGTATITVTVNDGNATVSDTFVLTVTASGAATFLFSEGFEGVGFENAGWTKSGSPNENYTATPLHGAESINAVGNQYVWRNFQYGSSFYMYFQVRWNTWVDSNNILMWDDSGWNGAAGLWADNSVIHISHGSVSARGTTTIAAGTKYHVWVEWTQAPNGTMKLFISTTGIKPATPEASITTGNGAATARLYVGPFDPGPNVVFDRFLVDDVPIGSNPGTVPNTGPTISDIADQTVSEDTPTSSSAFTVGDAETAAGSLTVTGTSNNTTLVPNGTIVFGGSGANRTVVVTPAANQTGSATVTVTVSDGQLSASDTFIVTVTPVNDSPTISNIADLTVNEDTATAAIAFTVGDAETAAGSLTVSGSSSDVTLVPNANIVFGGSGASRTVTVTPAPSLSGTATITVTVNDGTLNATDTFVLTVTSVNDAPTISNIADQTVNEDAATGAIAFTVSDVETAAASLTVSGTSSNVTLIPNGNIAFGGSEANRTVTVTPAANQSGTATITVTVSDGSLNATDTFVVTVAGVNDNPTISNIADQAVNEDATTGPIAFTVGDVEIAAGMLTLTGASSDVALVPNASIAFGGSGASRTVTVTPAANQSGTATITVTVSDGTLTAVDTFVLTVNAVNDAPTISAIVNQSVVQDTSTAPIAFTVGDVETAADGLTVTGSSSTATLVPDANIVFGGSGVSRTVTITPATGQTGTATITVTVSDGTLTASIPFTLTVTTAGNASPTISDIVNQSVNEDTATGAIAFTVADAETAAGSLTVTGTSSNTTLVPNANVVLGGAGADRTVTVTPAVNQSGTSIITVTVSDGTLTASDTFVLTVAAVNDTPTISDITNQSVNEDTATAALAFTVDDVETAAGSLTLTGASSNTALVPNANIVFAGSGASRTVQVTPVANQSGTTTITVNVSDGALTASDTFVLAVSAVNDAPTISDITNQSVNEDTATAQLAFTIGDVETAAGSLTLTGTSSNTALVPNASIVFGGSGASRTVRVTPAANQSGTTTVTVTVSDGTLPATDTFTVTVVAVNDSPTISNIADQIVLQDTATGAIAFTVNDIETAAGSLTLIASSSNLTLVPEVNVVFGGSGANRTVTVTPAAGQIGTATVTVTVSDGTAVASDTFILTVNPSGGGGAPTYLFSEGFEGTGFENSGWTKSGTPNENYTAIPLNGAQSLNAVGAQYIWRPFQYATSFNLYFQVRWNTWQNNRSIMFWDDASWGQTALLWADKNNIYIDHGSRNARGTTRIATNTTYHVWVEWTKGSGTDGTMKLFISTTGVKPAAPEALITTGNGNATERIYIGGTASGPNIVYDRILVDDVPIGSNP